MAMSGHHTTSHTNRKIGVRRFHREIICKRRETIHFIIFGSSVEIGVILISDNSGASGSSGFRMLEPSVGTAGVSGDEFQLEIAAQSDYPIGPQIGNYLCFSETGVIGDAPVHLPGSRSSAGRLSVGRSCSSLAKTG